MGILAWIVFGFVVGLVARAIMPGEQRMGLVLTTLLGVGGSFTGGALASLLMHRPIMTLYPVGFIGSVVGALVLLVIGSLLRGRSR